MGIDATRKWSSEGYARVWPNRIATTEAAAARAAALWQRIARRP
jgi:3-polyprenyl-4-hydroxybenzoate decarboxylase